MTIQVSETTHDDWSPIATPDPQGDELSMTNIDGEVVDPFELTYANKDTLGRLKLLDQKDIGDGSDRGKWVL